MAGYLIKDTTKEEREQIVCGVSGIYGSRTVMAVLRDWRKCIRHTSREEGASGHQHGISCRLCIRRGSARPQVLSHVIIVCGKDGFPA